MMEEKTLSLCKRLDENLWVIDLMFKNTPRAIASYLLIGSQEAVLIECGPSTTLHNLLEGIRELGIARDFISGVLVTHIHLDHAGSAGLLIQQLPNAKLYVHGIGAPHMANPERLLASAKRVYGNAMEDLWGEVIPVEESRVVSLKDKDQLVMADRTIEILYTPGHASHHVTYIDRQSNTAFTGDVAGVRLNEMSAPLPPTPPPDLDLEKWRTSIKTIKSYKPSRLYLTHFGEFQDVDHHLDELERSLFDWRDYLLDKLDNKKEVNVPELARDLEAYALSKLNMSPSTDPLIADTLRLISGYEMDVQGFLRYFYKQGYIQEVKATY